MIQHHREDRGDDLSGYQEVKQRLQRERAPSAVTMTARSTSGSVSSLIILSSVSQTCCSAHQRHLQEFCVPTVLKLSANMLKTVWCSSLKTRAVLLLWPPASPFVMFQHLLVLFSLLTIGFMALLLVFTRQTSERCSYFQEKPQEYYKHKLLHEGGGTGRVWLRGGVKQGDPTYIRLFADNLVLLVLLRLSWRWTRATCSQLGFTA